MAIEGKDEKGKFALGNLFSIGNTGGRPPVFNDSSDMFDKIAEYIKWADDQKGKEGKGLYTLEGCALYLGFASVQSMYDNEKRDAEFSYVINRYRLFLTEWNVQKLYWAGTTNGAIFWLKNKSDYKDEVTQHQNTRITKVDIEVIKSDVPLSTSEKDVDV